MRIKDTTLATIAIAAALLPWGAPARADVLSPAPEDCPRGSRGEDCHGPPRCAPWTCTDDGDCTADMRCQSLELCIDRVNCAGREMIYVDRVVSACGEGSSCTEGTCQTRRVCVASETVEEDASVGNDAGGGDDATPDGDVEVRTWGCGGCRLSGSNRAGGALLLALIPALIIFSLRRRASR